MVDQAIQTLIVNSYFLFGFNKFIIWKLIFFEILFLDVSSRFSYVSSEIQKGNIGEKWVNNIIFEKDFNSILVIVPILYPLKIPETKGLLVFSGDIKWEYWLKMGLLRSYLYSFNEQAKF